VPDAVAWLPLRLILVALAVVAAALTFAALWSHGAAQSNVSQRQVVTTFRAAGIRLSAPRLPASPSFPVTFYAPSLKAYVLVWPSASVREAVVKANAPPSSAVTELVRSNVEIDLPAQADAAIRRAKSVIGMLNSRG
jgi:hypothetical protein